MHLFLNLNNGADVLRQVVAEFLCQANPSAALRVIALGFDDASASVAIDTDARRLCREIAKAMRLEESFWARQENGGIDGDAELPHL